MKKITAFLLAVMLMILPFTTSLAASKSVKFTVTVTCTLKTKNHHVGSDWEIVHFLDDEEYFKKTNTVKKAGKDTISLTQGSTLKISVTVTEDDKDYPDVTTEEITRKISANDIKKGFTEKVEVIVQEGHGRYKGKTATWEIKYEFKP